MFNLHIEIFVLIVNPFLQDPQLWQSARDYFNCTYASDCHESVLTISEGDNKKSENSLVLKEQWEILPVLMLFTLLQQK